MNLKQIYYENETLILIFILISTILGIIFFYNYSIENFNKKCIESGGQIHKQVPNFVCWCPNIVKYISEDTCNKNYNNTIIKSPYINKTAIK